MKNNLKPCPFCGKDVATVVTNIELNELEPHEEPEQFAVVCDFCKGGCGSMSGWAMSEERAVENWNKRK